MARIARALLDRRLEFPEQPTLEQATAALTPLGQVDWRFHQVPWRGLLLTSVLDGKSGSRKWSIVSESRKPATEMAIRVVRWMIGDYQLGSDEEQSLKEGWTDRLLLPSDEKPGELWEDVKARRQNASH